MENNERSATKKTLFLVSISIALVLMLSLFVFKNQPEEKVPLTPNSVGETMSVTVAQWGQERYLIYLPVYLAIEEGFFQKNGLDVQIIFTGNDDQTFASVVSGDAQFGIGDPVFAAISQEKGYPARVIATVVGGVAIWGVTNDTSVPVITEPKQLAGLKIGTFPSPSTNYTLMKELVTSLPEELPKPTIVQSPIGGQLALLESQSAQIAMLLEPGASLAEQEGYRVVYSSPQFHGPFVFTGITTTKDVLDANPEMALQFVTALEEAIVSAHKDPESAIRVGKTLFPDLSAEVVERAVQRMLNENTFPQHALVDDEAWQRALSTRLSVGDLKRPQATDITVDNSYAKRAMEAIK